MISLATIVRTDSLNKEFAGRSILRDLSLRLNVGECLVVTGANGVGKTTLLRCLAGVTRPSSGIVRWSFGAKNQRRAPVEQIGYVAHEPQLYANLTVWENLLFAARMHSLADPRRRVNDLLCQCALLPYANATPSQLSRGIQQRVSIGRALLHQPRLLLMDEPFTALDQRSCRWLEDVIRGCLRNSRGICLTTHHPESLSNINYRLLNLHSGCVETLSVEPPNGIAA